MLFVHRVWRSAFVAYYGLWLRTAFAGPWGWLCVASTLITFVVPLAGHQKPEWGDALKAVGWQLTLAICASYAVLRAFLAPYWIWRRDHPSADPIDAQLGEFLAAGNELMARRIPRATGVLPGMDERPSLEALTGWLLDADDWVDSTRDYVGKELSLTDAAVFMDISGGFSFSEGSDYNHQHKQKKNELRYHIKNLRQIRSTYLSRRTTISSTLHA